MKKYMYCMSAVLLMLIVIVIGINIYYTDCAKNKEHNRQAYENISPINNTDSFVNSEKQTDSSEVSNFYLVLKDNTVSIYKGEERSFYDYADINITELPIEIKEQLKLGLYINNIDELYEFLQAYSS